MSELSELQPHISETTLLKYFFVPIVTVLKLVQKTMNL